jgi:DNA-binding response OmpR family regulator
MQSTLENPEKKAESTAKDKMELNDQGELSIIASNNKELTADIKPLKFDGQGKKFNVVFIDSNREFLNFMNAHLREVYNFHVYDNIKDALPDIEMLNADLVICKQDMDMMTGSELCNQFKMDPRRSKTKFVLLTDSVLTPQDMTDLNITLAADDYLAKPFNMKEAVMRFNKLMGLGPIDIDTNTIEGGETRRLESRNASMTTASISYENEGKVTTDAGRAEKDVPEQPVIEVKIFRYGALFVAISLAEQRLHVGYGSLVVLRIQFGFVKRRSIVQLHRSCRSVARLQFWMLDDERPLEYLC